MTKQIRRITQVVFLMFLALMTAASIIQVIAQPSLEEDPRNTRTLLDSYSTKRGAIIVGRTPIAESVAVDDQYKYLREYAEPEVYAPITGYYTTTKGRAGIESAMNQYLTGSSSSQFLEQLSDTINGRTPQGASVTLTIDDDVQQAAWDALGDHKGAVVALEPSTGKVLALVSKPSYDPNDLAQHDTEAVTKAYEKLNDDPDAPLKNRAIAGDLYHPGSTFKLVVASAALENGYTADSEFDNPAKLKLVGSTSEIRNASRTTCGSGDKATIATALSKSCNIPFAELGLELGSTKISDQAEKFGFGKSFDIPLTVTESVYPKGDQAQLMLSAFGQWDVRATPLQIAMVSSAIANDGTLMKPNLISQVRNRDLNVLQEFTPETFSNPISEETAESLTEMMEDSVAKGAATNAKIDGVDVAGKTGTAENGEGMKNTVWFTGFAPADDPQIAIAVAIEDSDGSGDSVAAPVAKKVMKAVLGE